MPLICGSMFGGRDNEPDAEIMLTDKGEIIVTVGGATRTLTEAETSSLVKRLASHVLRREVDGPPKVI